MAKKKKYDPMDELTEVANALKGIGYTQKQVEKEFEMYQMSREEIREFVKKIYAKNGSALRKLAGE